MPNGLLTPSQAAAVLGVTSRTVRRYLADGRLRAAGHSPLGHSLYDPAEVETLASTPCRSPVPSAEPTTAPDLRSNLATESPSATFDPPLVNHCLPSRTRAGRTAVQVARQPIDHARTRYEVLPAEMDLGCVEDPTHWDGEARRIPHADLAERRRLEELKRHGLSLAHGSRALPHGAGMCTPPVAEQAKVAQMLDREVTSQRFPDWQSLWNSQQQVGDLVDRKLAGWRELEAMERLRSRMVERAGDWASLKTCRWEDAGQAEAAKSAVVQAVQNRFDPGMREADVDAIVDEVLQKRKLRNHRGWIRHGKVSDGE